MSDDYTPAQETSDELWNRPLAVRITGPFLFSRTVLTPVLAQGKQDIINTASISSLVAGGGDAAYTASEHAVLGFTRQLAFDYAIAASERTRPAREPFTPG